MDEKRILIVGANGQLGLALRKMLPNAQALDRDKLDITDLDQLKRYDWAKVDTIINASGYTNVDVAETPEGRQAAWLVNGVGVANLAHMAAKHGLTLVHISTDYVYDGSQTKPYAESDPVAPLGVYAQSKLAGELAASVAAKHYILRTSWLIGDGNNFVRTMLGLAAKNVSPTVVNDQVGRLTFAPMLAEAIVHLIKTGTNYGIYNVSNDGQPASWADITSQIFSDLGRNDLTVTGTTTEKYFASKPGMAPRPKQSTFDLSKIKATGLQLRDWQADLKEYISKQEQ